MIAGDRGVRADGCGLSSWHDGHVLELDSGEGYTTV